MQVFGPICTVCLSLCVFSVSSASNNDKANGEGEGSASEKPKVSPLELYKHLFKQKRSAHKDAVKTLLRMDDYEKQHKMMTIVLSKLFKVMTDAKVKLMEAGFTPGDPVPLKEDIRDAFSQVAENTAFFGDLLLRLPQISHSILDKHRDWDLIIRWAVSFCNETEVFDGSDATLLNLMAQELNIVERDPNYINPFKEDVDKVKKQMEEELRKEKERQKKEEKKKKREKRKGPRLSAMSHTEL